MSGESTPATEGGNPGDLRAQLEAALAENKALKSQPDRAAIEAEVRASLARESAVGQALVASNVPQSVTPLVLEKLGDANVTNDSVLSALRDLGFASEQAPVAPDPTPTPNPLSEVASLSGQVQAAAEHGTDPNFFKRLDKMEEEATDFRDLSHRIVAEGNEDWERENQEIREFKTRMAFPGL